MPKNNAQTANKYDPHNLQIGMLINGLSLLSIDHKNLKGLILKGRHSPFRQKIFKWTS